jgi:hypothetical protein
MQLERMPVHQKVLESTILVTGAWYFLGISNITQQSNFCISNDKLIFFHLQPDCLS